MHLRNAWLLVIAAVSALWWVLGAAGNLQTAEALFSARGRVGALVGAVIASPWSGALCTCVCLLVYAGLHVYDRWANPKPRFSIRVQRGVMRIPGIPNRPTADIVIDNSGPPFDLVAHAKLAESPGGKAQGHGWQYGPRKVIGGTESQWFHMASLRPSGALIGAQWIPLPYIEVHGEHMIQIQAWEGLHAFRIVVEWKFFVLRDQTNYPIGECAVAISMSEDCAALIPEIISMRVTQ